MSRAKEIKEKQELQARLASVFSSKTLTVLSWLNTDENATTTKSKNHDELSDSRIDFFKLPVVATGAGLSLGDTGADNENNEDTKNDIATVGEFIKSNKKISTLAKKKFKTVNTRDSLDNSVYRIQKDDSKATIALKNKMRQSKRVEIRNTAQNSQFNNKRQYDSSNRQSKEPYQKTQDQHNDNDEDDDDDDEDAYVQKTTKKTSSLPLQFGKKKK